MNRNVLIGGISFVFLLIGIFIINLKDEKTVPLAQKSLESHKIANTIKPKEISNESNLNSNPPPPKEDVINISQDEAKELLIGYWFLPNVITLNNQSHSVQLEFVQVSNPDLKNGNKVQGFLYTINNDDNSKQSIELLEPIELNQNKYQFSIKRSNVASFYDDGYFSDQTSMKKVEVIFNKGSLDFQITIDSYPETNQFFTNITKIDSSNFNDILNAYSAKTPQGESFKLDLKKIKSFSNDFGELSAKGNYSCSGSLKVKFRPLSEKIALVTTGQGTSCARSTTFKLARGDNKTIQAIVYRQGQVPYELNFSLIE